jgi:hypothetical protein
LESSIDKGDFESLLLTLEKPKAWGRRRFRPSIEHVFGMLGLGRSDEVLKLLSKGNYLESVEIKFVIRFAKFAEDRGEDDIALLCWRFIAEKEIWAVYRGASLLRKLGRASEELRYLLSLSKIHPKEPKILARIRQLKNLQISKYAIFDEESSLGFATSNPLLDFEHFQEKKSNWRSRGKVCLRGRRPKPKRILVVSHTWKFILPILEQLEKAPGIEVRTLDVSLSEYHTPALSGYIPQYAEELLDWCDLVFVEWANENALWAIDNAPKNTRIVIRLHSYELTRPFPLQIDWTRVSDLIVVSEPNRRRLVEAIDPTRFGCKVHVLPNLYPLETINDEKFPSAQFTIGMVQYDTFNKNPLLAIEIALDLHAKDKRWRLRLAGKPIQWDSLNWPVEYVKKLRQKWEDLLEVGALEEDGWQEDLQNWWPNVGYVLSCSFREGTHESVREGICSGAVGVIFDWPWALNYGGAASVYPNSFIFKDQSDAVEYLSSLATSGGNWERGALERAKTLKDNSSSQVMGQYLKVLGV